MGAKHLALVVGLALVATAGVAVAAYEGRSIWGGNNPGQGGEHAAMPDAAAEHNRAGVDHPVNEPGGGGGAGSSNGPDDENETGEGGGEGCQPADVPPAHAKDGVAEDGKPDDVPPAHAKDGVPSGCHDDGEGENPPA